MNNDQILAELSELLVDDRYILNSHRIKELVESWDENSDSFSVFLRIIQHAPMFPINTLKNLYSLDLIFSVNLLAYEIIDGFSDNIMLVVYMNRLEDGFRPLTIKEMVDFLAYFDYEYEVKPDNDTMKGIDLLKEVYQIRVGAELEVPEATYMINAAAKIPQELTPEDYNQDGNVDPATLYGLLTDKTAFRCYGPVNPFTDEDYSIIDDNTKYGGARMLLDFTFLNREHEDWFVGHCENCKRKIKGRRFAVRKPVFLGGWIGCYCSWQCTHIAMMYSMPDLEIDYAALDIELAMVREFQRQCDEIGIYSRV